MARNEMWVKPVLTTSKDPEGKQLIDWFAHNAELSNLDTRVVSYPATSILGAFTRDDAGERHAVLYLPVQQVFMLESTAPNPDANDLDRARALREIVKVVNYEAMRAGVGEVWFACSDPAVATLAEQGGFQKMDLPMYRLRVL